MKDQQDLQQFISEDPWLLNLNYERVVELPHNGLEVQLGDHDRSGLISRDTISRCSVVVEFTFAPFYREN